LTIPLIDFRNPSQTHTSLLSSVLRYMRVTRFNVCIFAAEISALSTLNVTDSSTATAATSTNIASRYRTVLTAYQLRVLRTCYAVSSRPDPATRDQLMEMTGLSARVIRVWFQNRRCKDKKKSVIKPVSSQAPLLTVTRFTGTGPYIAPSPS